MEFLPIMRDGNRVYAGFWKRLGAAAIDLLVWIPFIIFFYYIQSINIPIAIVAAVIYAFSFSIFCIFFNLRYGGTLGKLAVGIRVTKPNGEMIEVREALLRSSVDIIFGLLFACFQVFAICQVDSDKYLIAGYMDRVKLIMPHYPEFSNDMNTFSDVWYCSEMVVLLFNKRKRALHDFIAGTVVVQKEYRRTGSIVNS